MKFTTIQAGLVGVFITNALAVPAPHPEPEPQPLPTGEEELDARGLWGSQAKPIVVRVPAARGSVKGSTKSNVDYFNAIPFADPPVGSLRLKPPRKPTKNLGEFDGTGIAPACPQMGVTETNEEKSIKDTILSSLKDSALSGASHLATTALSLPAFDKIYPGQEDCLTLNIQRPAGTKAGDKLPVLFWIFGGAFQGGGSNSYDAVNMLASAQQQGQPFVFVAINHRVAGFGFMPGKEILADGSANLGLLDQRRALEWVAENIDAFGGDPDKVTLWGMSSGGISVFDQLLLYGGDAKYNGKDLFRGAIINSGGLVPAEPVDSVKGQTIYDSVVKAAKCDGASDTLECLRHLDYPKFLKAANSVPSFNGYTSVALSYLPRPDGTVLPASPEVLVAQNKFHAVPMIIGNSEDEGTILALYQRNVTTADDMTDYLKKYFFPAAPREKLHEFVELYEPADTKGSPFGTGAKNALYPGYKRVAAILGDLTFSLSRRTLNRSLRSIKPQMPVWSYLNSYGSFIPVVGTFHAIDTLLIFSNLKINAAESVRSYYLNFLWNLDPNKHTPIKGKKYPEWPQWRENEELMWFKNVSANSIIKDDFRSEASAWIDSHVELLHF
ncbi:hypothetical protein HIM_03545 [Hirsutella minnesotensis 3608]|uniref:Carboxylic ester hydrolase n=1 Tax=Hirsutella minnesotensis 3608 TaxID=1043627 RepID=A0A0F8A6K2_9HYPO|nr:hypothetical protein HIM_03545 [Hirsutella minnesotensis 3608]